MANVRRAHVAFYVLPDTQSPFDDMPEGSRGLLGIPVILALQTLRWSAPARTLECAFPSQPSDIRQTNLAFDAASPIVQADFQRQALEFSFDTGAQGTALYPASAKKFADVVKAAGKKESHTLTGVDGRASLASVGLPTLAL